VKEVRCGAVRAVSRASIRNVADGAQHTRAAFRQKQLIEKNMQMKADGAPDAGSGSVARYRICGGGMAHML